MYWISARAPGAEDLDRINRMDRINSTTNPVNPVHPVQTVASLSAAPDSLKILVFIGAPVEELTNKTAIKEYYEAGFDALAGVLAKNKKKLKGGYDPTRREPKEKLQAEFYASVGKLIPLLKRIEATDGLIDAIVYKLYGLTEDEIKIVEESISGNKDFNTK